VKITGEAVGGWATAVALVVTGLTSYCTYQSQEKFNRDVLAFNKAQLDAMKESNVAAANGLQLQREAAKETHESAVLQREAAAVDALGRYLDKTDVETQAWSSAEAIIDLAGDDPAWRATARRAIVHHPGNLRTIECELYSEAFKQFAAKTFGASVEDLCAHRARPNAPGK
jgi:hypothetical protein